MQRSPSVCLQPSLPASTLSLNNYMAGFANTDADRDVAERSVLIKNMMEDIGEQAVTEAIPIPNVSPHHLVQLLRETNQSL